MTARLNEVRRMLLLNIKTVEGGIMKLLKPSEVAERLGVTYQTLYRWAQQGRIAYLKMPSGHMRFTEEQLAEFIEQTKRKGTKAGKEAK